MAKAQKQQLAAMFKMFGRVEDPFGDRKLNNIILSLEPRSKCYRMRNVPTHTIADGLHEYILNQENELALRAALLKKQVTEQLTG